MDRQKVFAWAKKKYRIEPDYPWNDDNGVLRHPDNKKWFAVVLTVRRDKLGLSGDNQVDVINVKSDPDLIGSLRTREGFHPAYHMNKDKWLSIRLDNTVPEDEIKNLINLSYQMTMPKKKERK